MSTLKLRKILRIFVRSFVNSHPVVKEHVRVNVKVPTTGVNFINVLCTNFSYERCFCSFFKLRFSFGEKFVQKTWAKNVDEIDSR